MGEGRRALDFYINNLLYYKFSQEKSMSVYRKCLSQGTDTSCLDIQTTDSHLQSAKIKMYKCKEKHHIATPL